MIKADSIGTVKLRNLLLKCCTWDNSLRTASREGLLKMYESCMNSPHHKDEFFTNFSIYWQDNKITDKKGNLVEIIAPTLFAFWALVREDLRVFNATAHADDCMGVYDYVLEHKTLYGWDISYSQFDGVSLCKVKF